jgi:hypothetical protein
MRTVRQLPEERDVSGGGGRAPRRFDSPARVAAHRALVPGQHARGDCLCEQNLFLFSPGPSHPDYNYNGKRNNTAQNSYNIEDGPPGQAGATYCNFKAVFQLTLLTCGGEGD